MKRDMELIRLLLQKIEADEIGIVHVGDVETKWPGYSTQQVLYHLELMQDANLISASVDRQPADDGRTWNMRVCVDRLTNSGHDFLEASKNNSIWEKTINTFSDQAIGMTVDLVYQTLISFARSQLFC